MGEVAPTVGVVGDVDLAGVAPDGLRLVAGGVSHVLDAEPVAVVAVGEPAVLELARVRPAVPLVPVAAGRGVRSVPRSALGKTLARLADGDVPGQSHPLVAVELPSGDRKLVLFDAMVVTAEPAHISEFTVATAEERVARFRADGIVVATPAGTAGYARGAGGPVMPPDTGVLAVVPIAPFATTLDHWVVPLEELSVTVERDSTAEVLADDRTAGTATVGETVSMTRAGSVELLQFPWGQSPFPDGD